MTDHNKKSVAAPDVAIPHRTDGVVRDTDGWKDNLPGSVRGRDRAPPKEGPYPADCETPDGYGQKREGKLRVSGDSRADRIGKR